MAKKKTIITAAVTGAWPKKEKMCIRDRCNVQQLRCLEQIVRFYVEALKEK